MSLSFSELSSSSPSAYSVAEVTRLIKQALEGNFKRVWVEGEVSNLKKTVAGHVYFTLKDEHAQLSAVMFRATASRYSLSQSQLSQSKSALENGLRIRVRGDISVYEKGGNYQIICQSFEKVGLGELQMRFLELKEKLYQQGWFAPERKQPLPAFPKGVGIITSRTGAAIRDMQQIIRSRMPTLPVFLFPVKVQGDGSAQEIASAIEWVNQHGFDKLDVLIVGRGGGSLEDLWAFNEHVVAKAIFESRLPVVSAVGHEVDFTIADFVADVRAETPSKAAFLVSPDRDALIDALQRHHGRLFDSMHSNMRRLQEKLKSFSQHYAFRDPVMRMQQFTQRLDDAAGRLAYSVQHQLKSHRTQLGNLSQMLNSLSPNAVLERGYAIVQQPENHQVVDRVADVKHRQPLSVTLKDGRLDVVVEDIHVAAGKSEP